MPREMDNVLFSPAEAGRACDISVSDEDDPSPVRHEQQQPISFLVLDVDSS